MPHPSSLESWRSLEPWLRATVAAHGGRAEDVRLMHRESGAVLALSAAVVVKVHPPDTAPGSLGLRLRLASDLPGRLLAPLHGPVLLPDGIGAPGQLATVWPRVAVLAPGDAQPPWQEAARTLAGLHLSAVPGYAGGLRCGAADRLDRALARLRAAAGPAADVVLAAGNAVRRELAGSPQLDRSGQGQADAGTGYLVHGDWHLGQLGRDDSGSGWLLLDVDDLGIGDPAWDLARPAGFHAAGLLDDHSWTAFLDAYRAAGGPAVPADGDPWTRLDLPARAAVVVAAARELLHGAPDAEGLDALVTACARMPH